jgi:hypothetical protein
MAAIADPAELAPGRLPIIPAPPKRGAVRSLQRALLARTPADGTERGLTDEAAQAIAYAVADPAETRNYSLKHVSYMRVPGGTLTLIRDQILVNRVITYPVNPRVLDTEAFPAAGDQTATTQRLFWPERDLSSDPDGHSGLLLRGGTRQRVSRVLQDHAKRLRHQNRLDTIATLGVLRPIIVMPMLVVTDEEDEPTRRSATVLTSVEGSSRTAWSHLTQDLDPAAPLYGPTADPAAAQAVARQLSEVRTAPASAVTKKDLERARTLLIPAEIIIGFTPDEDDATPASVVDQLLGLTHIDPPRQWSDQATESKIGDKILAELHATGHITGDEQEWLAGMFTPDEAGQHGIDPWLARRAARLLWLVSRAPGDAVSRAVSQGIRNASFQRRVQRGSKATAAAALALRALSAAELDAQRPIRAALPRAMGMPAFFVSGQAGNGNWTVTKRSPDELRDTALQEIGDEKTGPATLELCALASWALISRGKLSRGTALGPDRKGDPRDPEQILAALMDSELGIRVMHRAILDDRAGGEPREIDIETFAPVPTADGSWRAMDEAWIRRAVVPRRDADGDRDADAGSNTEQDTLTPQRRLDLALEQLDGQVRRLGTMLSELTQIREKGGEAIIAREGIDDDRGKVLVDSLVAAITTIHTHRATFQARYGSAAAEDDAEDSTSTDTEL